MDTMTSKPKPNNRMSDLGFNDDVSAGSRKFHIQTATLVDDGMIRTEVFEKGRLLYVEHHRYERRNPDQAKGPEERLRHLVDQFHQSVIEEIDCLFEMSERIFEEDIASAHEKIGLVFLYSHIFDKAENHFQRAIELEAKRYSSYVYLARCCFLQKRYNQAYEIVTDIIKQDIKYPDIYNMMGLVLMEKGRSRKSLQFFREAIKHNSTYIEAYFNFAEAILRHIKALIAERKEEEIKKSLTFLRIILKKIINHGDAEDRKQSQLVGKLMSKLDLGKALAQLNEYREHNFIRQTPPEIAGYKFYLRLLYSEEEMSTEALETYEEKISEALQKNPSYPDLWQYLALIHLMQCRHYFLKGLDNFRDATRINPHFDRAVKNLRLVENDGREFLALIKTIV